MGATFLNYGTIYTGNLTFTKSGSILPALLNSRYEIDHVRAHITSADPGSSISIGFGESSNSPQIFYAESSMTAPYDQHLDQPGIGNPGVANQALTITITGTNVNVILKVGYHIVPVTILPASIAGPG